jgi:hypothetical protein
MPSLQALGRIAQGIAGVGFKKLPALRDEVLVTRGVALVVFPKLQKTRLVRAKCSLQADEDERRPEG